MNRVYIKTAEELSKFLVSFNTNSFAFDTETTSLKFSKLKIEGISLCDGLSSCYIFIADYAKEIINTEKDKLLELILKLFNDSKFIAGHNILYDLKVLYKLGIEISEGTELYCSMVADHLLNENRRHGLKFLAQEELGICETTAFTDIEDHSSDEFFKYACHDAEWTWGLMKIQLPDLKEQDLSHVYRNIEMPFQRVLLDMEVNGMLVNKKKVKETAKELVKSIFSLEMELYEILGERPEIDCKGNTVPKYNFNSSKQLAQILFVTLGLPVLETTPSGAPKTGASVLEKLSENEFVSTLIRYKIARKLYTAYFSDDAQILSNLDPDNRVRPSFRDTGTVTGRLSCSQPNLQQLPKMNKKFPVDTRKCFIVPEGKTMITCDYSGQEVAVAAEVSKDPTLIDALNKGQDMHLRIANQFYDLGIPQEVLFKTHPEYASTKEKFDKERSQAKTITFGLFYGKGAYGFAKDFGMDEQEAQEIVDKYFAGMPKLKEAIENAHEQVKRNGFVSSLSGRRRRFIPIERYGRKIYTQSNLRQSFNFLIQGFSADMMRMAMTKVREIGNRNKHWELKAIATVHDEAVYEVKNEYTEIASLSIKKAFESVVNFCVPVVGDIGIGKTYSEAK